MGLQSPVLTAGDAGFDREIIVMPASLVQLLFFPGWCSKSVGLNLISLTYLDAGHVKSV